MPASEWNRKKDVRATPSSGEVDSTIVILAALVLATLGGALMLRWDLAAAALIGLGLCAAIGIQAANNPATALLAATLGYTMWWGSELGFWVWLILAWALWLGLLGLSRPALGAEPAPARPPHGAATADAAASRSVLGSLASLSGTVAVGSAVAATGKPDSHVYEYQPIRAAAAASSA